LTRRLNAVLLVALVLIGLPFAWLMLQSSTTGHATKPVTIGQLRRLAGSLRGDLPVEVRYEAVAMRLVVSDLLAAGSGLRPVPFVIRAYALILSDGSAIAIDRGMHRKVAARHRLHNFDPQAQAAVDRMVSASRLTLLLSRNAPHSDSDPAQLGWRGVAQSQLPYAGAPGVVVLPASDIAAGKQMIYVHLQDGHELLFAGDVAPAKTSWRELRPPARLVTDFVLHDDREAIGAWLRTIGTLKAAAPQLQIVPGHDSVIPRILHHGFATTPALRQL
jgi:hypothetical protein